MIIKLYKYYRKPRNYIRVTTLNQKIRIILPQVQCDDQICMSKNTSYIEIELLENFSTITEIKTS